jgi:(p)ppGpp synthase/HD superfamily hydrolase
MVIPKDQMCFAQACNGDISVASDARLIEQLENLLICAGAKAVRHSGRTLFDHLLGTKNLLVSWEADFLTQAVGMLHSVFGTLVFKHSVFTSDREGDLRALIGDRVVDLVKLFSCMRRHKSLLRAIRTKQIEISRTRTSDSCFDLVTISDDTLQTLVLVECANLVEQKTGVPFILAILHEHAQQTVLLTKQAYEYLLRYVHAERTLV